MSAIRGNLPRIIGSDTMWTGRCLDVNYQGEVVHSHFSAYLIKGSEKCIMIDTGHPIHSREIEQDIDDFLDGRIIDYIMPTHAEFPHGGLMPKWLKKFPNAVAIGDLRDYDLYYPEFKGRMTCVLPGDTVDLGDRKILFVPAIWRDIPNTLWAFDSKTRTLFVSDGFSYLHYHRSEQCSLFSDEVEPPNPEMVRFFNHASLHWTGFNDVTETFSDVDALLGKLDVKRIASGHGPVISNIDAVLPIIKAGMAS
ncbi:MBL fold metallo-hydrolase (plasmid) [Mesorhizobium sp. ORM8.1]